LVFFAETYVVDFFFLFFFSSRRRHTISKRDWSSDVCSSDLRTYRAINGYTKFPLYLSLYRTAEGSFRLVFRQYIKALPTLKIPRSEERRVGKECRYWCFADREKKELED